MQQVSSRDMSIALQFGNIAASISAEGVSWSPDVASDMQTRLVGMVRDVLAEAAMYGLLPSEILQVTDDADDEELVEGEPSDDGE